MKKTILHVLIACHCTWSAVGATTFEERIAPILTEYCYDCHGDGARKGDLALDAAAPDDRELWWKVLKMTRSELMPPSDKAQPDPDQREELEAWIKNEVFQFDRANPDPGRVTVRRLNRIEYRNTIRDLLGVDFDTTLEFPADDSGHGFDNIADVLTVSPLLMEKYFDAAKSIIVEAVPTDSGRRGGNHARFFPKPVPDDPSEREIYARELLSGFATKAYRRPVGERTVERLVAIASQIDAQPGKSFEAGIAQAMMAVIASPPFLFREEAVEPGTGEGTHPLIDEYALASRLSYFFWSSMPDEELIRLAAEHRLRENLGGQVERLLADPRSSELMRNFAGQWLQARDVEGVNIDSREVLNRELKRDPELERARDRFRALRRIEREDLTEEQKREMEEVREVFSRTFRDRREVDFGPRLRRAMRAETEMHFEYIVREDRRVVELLDSDYTFLNQDLARHYGIPGVEGSDMRRVVLPAESPRGGILTQGTTLAVTSNPDRTSPVKRGVFILDNILGTPPSPPPPDIPALEDAVEESLAGEITVAESLALHRAEPLCASCHDRMDPLGLALENFNAMGMWRDKEREKAITVDGKLITGETFTSVKALKQVLATERRDDFYRCLCEKMLTYALGRGLDYYDVQTVDLLLEKLQAADGRPSALIRGIVESAPFQRTRSENPARP